MRSPRHQDAFPVSIPAGAGAEIPPGVSDSAARGRLFDSFCKPLALRLRREGDRAGFEYLFRETSLESLNRCLLKIRDEEMTDYVLDGVLVIAEILSSEALSGIEQVRGSLKEIDPLADQDVLGARQLYDQQVENLGKYVFALGRKLLQIEALLEGCPFTGSAEELRGLYGQRTRDLAGDVRFLRLELNRWVRKFVPLNHRISSEREARAFLKGRIGAVVDDLGLRLKEIEESLSAAMFEQLVVFDQTLTRPEFFKSDLQNLVDIERLLSWLGELMSRVRDYDQRRNPEQLARVQKLLRGFRAEQFPALSGVRESDQVMFSRLTRQVLDYHSRGSAGGDDPVHLLLLLLGDLTSSLQRARAPAPAADPAEE